MPIFLRDAEFPRKIGVGVPKFLGKMVMLRDAYYPKGMLSFLGKLEWGCQNSEEKWYGGANFSGIPFFL